MKQICGDTMDILVLEDDPPIADFIAEALRDEGYNPHVAHTVSTAIAAIENSIPQLILLDLNIPTTHESNAFLAYWRSSSAHGVPIILITASSRVPALELLGVSGFLVKPFDLTDLFDHVKQYIGTRSPSISP